MEILRKRSLKAAIPVIIFCFIFGIVCSIPAISAIPKLIKGPQDLETVDFSSDIEGLYVTGKLYYIYGAYAEETKNGNVKHVEYIIDGGENYYMGMRVAKKDIDQADGLMMATFDYMEGLDDGTVLVETQYEVTGTIKKMPSENLSLYHEYIGWNTMDSQSKEIFLPYYLSVGDVGTSNMLGIVISIILAIVLFSIAIVILIRNVTGRTQRAVYDYINASPSPLVAKEKVEDFLRNNPMVNGLQYNREFICGQDGDKTVFGEMENLVWAYLHTVEHKRNFITIKKTYSIMLSFANHTRQEAVLKKEAHARQHLDQIAILCPHTIIGYSDELESLYINNFPEFLKLKYNTQENN